MGGRRSLSAIDCLVVLGDRERLSLNLLFRAGAALGRGWLCLVTERGLGLFGVSGGFPASLSELPHISPILRGGASAGGGCGPEISAASLSRLACDLLSSPSDELSKAKGETKKSPNSGVAPPELSSLLSCSVAPSGAWDVPFTFGTFAACFSAEVLAPAPDLSTSVNFKPARFFTDEFSLFDSLMAFNSTSGGRPSPRRLSDCITQIKCSVRYSTIASFVLSEPALVVQHSNALSALNRFILIEIVEDVTASTRWPSSLI